jgi:hypothetical protein
MKATNFPMSKRMQLAWPSHAPSFPEPHHSAPAQARNTWLNSSPGPTLPRGAVQSPEVGDYDEIIKFWTPERMAEAWTLAPSSPSSPIPKEDRLLAGADRSGYVLRPEPYAEHELSRINGILYFQQPGEHGEDLSHCSASVINSRSGNLILAAAHCFYTGTPEHHVWMKNVMFVPAYDGDKNATRLGKWPVHLAFIPSEFTEPEEDGHNTTRWADIAVARVFSLPQVGAPPKSLEEMVGNAFVTITDYIPFPQDIVKDIGYPEQTRFGGDDDEGPDGPYLDGEMRECNSYTRLYDGDPRRLSLLNCAPTRGNSGGPLILMSSIAGPAVVGVYVSTTTYDGQARLTSETFDPIYQAADSAVFP